MPSKGAPRLSRWGPCLQPRSVNMPPLTEQGVEEPRALAKHGQGPQLHVSEEAGPHSGPRAGWCAVLAVNQICPPPRNTGLSVPAALTRPHSLWKSGLQQAWRRGGFRKCLSFVRENRQERSEQALFQSHECPVASVGSAPLSKTTGDKGSRAPGSWL